MLLRSSNSDSGRAETPEEFWLCNRLNREVPVGVNTVERYRYERWRQTRNLVARAVRAQDPALAQGER